MNPRRCPRCGWLGGAHDDDCDAVTVHPARLPRPLPGATEAPARPARGDLPLQAADILARLPAYHHRRQGLTTLAGSR
jgi:hypothetical protein